MKLTADVDSQQVVDSLRGCGMAVMRNANECQRLESIDNGTRARGGGGKGKLRKGRGKLSLPFTSDVYLPCVSARDVNFRVYPSAGDVQFD